MISLEVDNLVVFYRDDLSGGGQFSSVLPLVEFQHIHQPAMHIKLASLATIV
jgi:hypothetical protein